MRDNISIKVIDNFLWGKVKGLIKSGWNNNHIFLKSDVLLKWSYSGYGENKDKAAIAVFDRDKLIGFRLFTPIELSVSDKQGKYVKQSVVSTLYYLLPEYRGLKIGQEMQHYMVNTYGSYLAIASNLKTSAPMHKKTGAFMLDKMYRYILPLNTAFANILLSPYTNVDQYLFSKDVKSIGSNEINPLQLAEIWSLSTKDIKLTSLNRTEEFWEWRYRDSPIYKYIYFGGKDDGAVILGRICHLFDENTSFREEKIFRILEFIPLNSKVWLGEYDDNVKVLLERVVKWAQQEGCVACEFYITTNCFDSILNRVGFKEINVNQSNKHLDCLSYYEPCSLNERLCNVSLYIDGYEGSFDFRNSYFTLSDADQDRPNIL